MPHASCLNTKVDARRRLGRTLLVLIFHHPAPTAKRRQLRTASLFPSFLFLPLPVMASHHARPLVEGADSVVTGRAEALETPGISVRDVYGDEGGISTGDERDDGSHPQVKSRARPFQTRTTCSISSSLASIYPMPKSGPRLNVITLSPGQLRPARRSTHIILASSPTHRYLRFRLRPCISA